MKPMDINEIIARVGGQVVLANICGVTQPTVHYWTKKGKPLIAEHAIAVEKSQKGQLNRQEIRPDLFDEIEGIA